MIERVNLRQSYGFYRKTNPKVLESSKNYQEDTKVYLSIVNGLMKYIMKKVLAGYDVTLGAKLGSIGIRGSKKKPLINDKGEIKGIAPDWGATKKLQASDPIAKENRTKVYCFNEHSDGIGYRFYWAKKKVLVTHKMFYSLSFARWNRREIPRLVKKEGKRYLLKAD